MPPQFVFSSVKTWMLMLMISRSLCKLLTLNDWPEKIEQLVSKLNQQNCNSNRKCVQILHSIILIDIDSSITDRYCCYWKYTTLIHIANAKVVQVLRIMTPVVLICLSQVSGFWINQYCWYIDQIAKTYNWYWYKGANVCWIVCVAAQGSIFWINRICKYWTNC